MRRPARLSCGLLLTSRIGAIGRRLGLIALLIVLACSDRPSPTATTDLAPAMTISDAVHSDGTDGFYFLPPLVPDPTADGVFDAGLSPTVEICAWEGGCVLPLLAEYTMSTGPGSETVRLVTDEELYIVDWHTDEFGLSVDVTYRIQVRVAGTLLGFADVDVVSGGNELKNVDTGEYIALNDGRTLPIKFRIEQGTVFVLGSTGGTVTAQDGSVELTIPEGALPEGEEIGITVEGVADADLPTELDLVAGAVYDFGPDGSEFTDLVELTIGYDETNLPDGVEEGSLVMVDEVGPGVWLAVPTIVDTETNRVTGLISGFSAKGLGGTLSAGGEHNCAATAEGVYCWGYNSHGQLGDGTRIDRLLPVPVQGAPDLEVLALGQVHSCGLSESGAAFCWGSNAYGQLGDGTQQDRTTPVPVGGGHSFVAISAGSRHTCAMTASGQGYCWGGNRSGQLGLAERTLVEPLPKPIAGGLTLTGIETSWFHTCGVTGSGDAYCWGSNVNGQLGDGSSMKLRPDPGPVAGGVAFQSVVPAYYSTCALDMGGTAYCWGDDGYGQLGDGLPVERSFVPVAVDFAGEFSLLAAGGWHACGLTPSGNAHCWGSNRLGQLGDGTTVARPAPVAVSGDQTFISLTAGGSHTCGLTGERQVACWGYGSVGTVGAGVSQQVYSAPTGVQDLPDVGSGVDPTPPTRISAGQTHACSIEPFGNTRCWGSDDRGQLGNGASDSSGPQGVTVSGGHQFSSVAAGRMHTCALTSSGQTYCWGDNRWGQLGDGTLTLRHEPVAVSGELTLRSLSASLGTTCAVSTSDEAYCWGVGGSGQRGDGTTTSTSAPIGVSGGLRFAGIAVGDSHACGITTAGDAYCWGRNDAGQLGDGTTTDRLVPTTVQTSLKFTSSVSVGNGHSCAVSQGGTLHCWGGNVSGQLGNGTTGTGVATPVQVSTSASFGTVTTGGRHTCGLDSGGNAHCWGFGLHGQLGYGGTGNRSAPVQVLGGHAFVELDGGTDFTCGLDTGEIVYCWGENGAYQLRDGTNVDRATPVTWIDADGDEVHDNVDNCPTDPNPGQADADGDGLGDDCDVDQIAFHSSRDGDDEVYLMNADGTGVFNLTQSPGFDFGPIWAPDRRRIAYRSDRAGNCDIRVVDVYTLVDVPLTSTGACEQNPRWSPDGSSIAYQAGTGTSAQVFIMNADGSGQTRLSSGSWNFEPEWSPDGSRLVFQSNRTGTTQIYVVNADGTGETNLSNNGFNDRASAWSPDGTRIAFDSDRGGGPEIWVMNADGTGQALLHGPVGLRPAWSPDGTRIAFEAGDLYVMNSDGTNVINVAPAAGQDRHPAWRFDGSRLVFDSQQDGGPPEVYAVSPDGSGITRLTDAAGSSQFPRWQLGR